MNLNNHWLALDREYEDNESYKDYLDTEATVVFDEIVVALAEIDDLCFDEMYNFSSSFGEVYIDLSEILEPTPESDTTTYLIKEDDLFDIALRVVERYIGSANSI